MKQFTNSIAALSLLTLFSCSNGAKEKEMAAENKDTATAAAPAETAKDTPPMDSATIAKAWEAYMTPGDMHKWMASTDGKWEAEITSWQGPEAPAGPVTKSSVENKMVMGGRYQESVYKGKMMGMDFEGHGLLAFDNAKKKFISTWTDNMSTGIMYMEGPYDEASKTINLTGSMTDAATGKDCDMRQVVKIVDDKNQVMDMYSSLNGKEYKMMEIKLTKK